MIVQPPRPPNTCGMKEGSETRFGAGYNVLPVFKRRLNAKKLITKPNSDVIYALSYATAIGFQAILKK